VIEGLQPQLAEAFTPIRRDGWGWGVRPIIEIESRNPADTHELAEDDPRIEDSE
jgi:hypothetical protein